MTTRRQTLELLTGSVAIVGAATAVGSASAPVPRRFAGQIITRARLPKSDKVVCLTFDDGPKPGATELVLKLLKLHGAKATFFLIGKHVQANPELVAQMVRDGHAVGNHSWSHAKSLTKAEAEREVTATAAAIERAGGVRPVVFRPPFGMRTSALAQAAQAQRLPLVLWSISSADTQADVTASTIANNILHTPYSGDVILMHDGGGDHSETVKALPTILAGLQQMGMQCITVPELLTRWDAQCAEAAKAKPKMNGAAKRDAARARMRAAAAPR